MLNKLCLFFILCLATNAWAINFFDPQPAEDELIPAEQAFQLNASLVGNQIHADFSVAPGYYLYKHQFKFNSDNPAITIGQPNIPAGQAKHDEVFGDVEVYYDTVLVTVPVSGSAGTSFAVNIHNQGCAEIGVCYPPMNRQFEFQLNASAEAAAPAPADNGTSNNSDTQSDAGGLAATLAANPAWAMLVFFGFGVLLSFNPCSYPMFPILSRIIVGQGGNITKAKGISLSGSYVLAMAIAYALAGIAVAAIGQNFFAAFQNPWVLGALCIVLLVLALSMFGLYEIQMPASWQSKLNATNDKQKSGSYLGAAIMGSLSALIVGACVLPPLTGALLYIANSGNTLIGGGAMFMFGLGMGVPLLAIGFSAGWLLPKAGVWMEKIKGLFGLFLLAAILLILERFASEQLVMFGWAALFVFAGIYFGATRRHKKLTLATTLGQTIAILVLVWGCAIAWGAIKGNTNPWQPLNEGQSSQNTVTQTHAPFIKVKSYADFKSQLNNHYGKLIMLDFYADWCIPCKVMEKEIFNDPEVQQALKGVVWLQADVTADDDLDKALKAKLQVINPPSVLFFNSDGAEVHSQRITGKLSKRAFMEKAKPWLQGS